MNWIDWAILAVLGVGLVYGLIRGLVGMVGAMVATVLAAWSAGLGSAQGALLLDRWADVTNRLGAWLTGHLPLSGLPATGEIASWLARVPMPEVYRNAVVLRFQAWVETGSTPTGGPAFLGHTLASGILHAGVWLVCFIVLRFLFGKLVKWLAALLNRTPGIGPLHRLAGGGIGLAEAGLVLVYLLGAVAQLSVVHPLDGITGPINQSAFAPQLLQAFTHVQGFWL